MKCLAVFCLLLSGAGCGCENCGETPPGTSPPDYGSSIVIGGEIDPYLSKPNFGEVQEIPTEHINPYPGGYDGGYGVPHRQGDGFLVGLGDSGLDGGDFRRDD